MDVKRVIRESGLECNYSRDANGVTEIKVCFMENNFPETYSVRYTDADIVGLTENEFCEMLYNQMQSRNPPISQELFRLYVGAPQVFVGYLRVKPECEAVAIYAGHEIVMFHKEIGKEGPQWHTNAEAHALVEILRREKYVLLTPPWDLIIGELI